MQFKEFLVMLSSFFLLATAAYLLFAGRINAFGASAMILATGIFSLFIWNFDTISSVVGSFGEQAKFRVEMNRIKEDVFAKADSVKHLGEEVARFAAHTVATRSRLVGDDHQENMLREREQIRALLVSIGSDANKITSTLSEIDQMVTFDLKRAVLGKIRLHSVSTHTPPPSQLESFIAEAELKFKNYDGPHSREQFSAFLREHKAYDESINTALDRLDLFMTEAHL